MIKPEAAFIQAVNRRVKASPNPPHIIKFADRFTKGIPDVLYIGASGCLLWVEYKIYPNKPTATQLDTLQRLMNYQQNIAIITKHPTKIIINDGLTPIENNAPWDWILTKLGNSHAPTETPKPARPQRCHLDSG